MCVAKGARNNQRKGGSRRADRKLTVRAIRRDPPDIRKLSRALISLAMAEAERAAQADQETRQEGQEADSSQEESEGDASSA